MKTRNFKTVLLALLFTSSAFSQHQLSGKILDENGNPIPDAKVMIAKTNHGTYSDSAGFYKLSNLETAHYDVVASSIDTKEETQSIYLDRNKEVNFILTTNVKMFDDFTVVAIRATDRTPTTFTNKTAEEIERDNYGQDLPYLLESIPSTVVTSDAGAGIGYTDFKIRGVDPTRTNITIDGIPFNDSESQGAFLVNIPDFSSTVSSMQVQRGVGTSSNGGSAFGASINMSTDKINDKPYLTLDNSFGSFNSMKNTVSMGTGMLADKFTVDARLSRVKSDGYIDRAFTDMKSLYLSGTYHGKKATLKANILTGTQSTYQAWNGVPESRLNGDEQGMIDYADRNGLSPADLDDLLSAGRTYNSAVYKNETDNYQQDHYQLHYNYKFSTSWNAKISGHYTRGRGYYENYRTNDKFSTYGFTPIVVEGETIKRMDLIRQKWLDNHFFGSVFHVNYNNKKGLDVMLGGGLNKYLGDHFGNVIWAQYMPNLEDGMRYYENNSTKYDGNLYLKATYQIKDFVLFADAQYRHVDYTFLGINDIGDEIIDVTQHVFYNFFNPKLGLSYNINNRHSVYASYAVGNREPVRKDFQEQTTNNRPEHETLYNLEAGYHMKYKKGFLNANIYHMLYDNQLVLTGEINDVGGYTRTNVKNSYRVGLELEGGYQPIKQLGISANLALSENKINDFVEYIDSYDASWNPLPQEVVHHGKTDLAFSPSLITGLNIVYSPVESVRITLMNKYVGKQFLDNTSNETRMMEGYYIAHFDAAYTFSFWKMKEITIGARINNIFNYKYANNGYTYSYLVGGDRTQENFYFPQAGINFMARLLIKL